MSATHPNLETRCEELLSLMVQDGAQAPKRFQPTPFWKVAGEEIQRDITLFGIEHFRAHPSAHHLYAGIDHPKEIVETYTLLSILDPAGAPHLRTFNQSQIGDPYQEIRVGGQLLTLTALNYLLGLALLKYSLPPPHRTSLLELGGGYGLLGEILLQLAPPLFYINVDIPPLAAVATYTLQSLFGPSQVLSYETSRDWNILDIETLQSTYKAVVLCPWQLPHLRGKVDIALNYISFQEMEPSVVAAYAEDFKRLAQWAILLRNSDVGKPGVEEKIYRQDYLRFFSPWTCTLCDHSLFGREHKTIRSDVLLFQPSPHLSGQLGQNLREKI